MMLINFLVISSGVFMLCLVKSGSSQEPCASRIFQRAVCMEFKLCGVFYNEYMLKRGRVSDGVRNLIDDSWCGIRNRQHYICCPISDSDDQTTTTFRTLPPETTKSPIGHFDFSGRTDNSGTEPEDFSTHPNVHLLPQDKCGNVNDNRVLNGNRTQPFEYPWMVIIQVSFGGKLRDVCGGTIISPRYILTAAHCITFRESGIIVESVILGEHNRKTDMDCIDGACSDYIQYIPVQETIPHPRFAHSSAVNDIGLIRLLTRIDEYTESIQPICLPMSISLQTLHLTKILITGWGITENGSESDVLLKALIPITDNDSCDLRSSRIQLQPSHLCAGGNLSDSCRGDSGGPGIAPANTDLGLRYVQFGIVSAGNDCDPKARTNGLYTRVSSFIGWILDSIH